MKKFISLILSAFLFLSNMSVFAQEITAPSAMFESKVIDLQRRTEALSKKLIRIKTSFDDLIKSYKNAPHYMEYLANNDGDHIAEMEASRQKWHKAIDNPNSAYYKEFKTYQAKMNDIFDEFTSLSSDINYANKYVEEEVSKKVIERLSYKYTGKSPQVYPEVMPIVDDVAIKHYRKILTVNNPSDLTKVGKEVEEMYTYLNVRLNVEDLSSLTETAKTALKIDHRAEIFISQHIKTPREIIAYAYNEVYQEAQRAAVKISLEAGQESTSLISTVRGIQKYIRNFGTSSANRVSFFQLLRKLRLMDKATRTAYVREITGLSEGERQLLTDISKLDYKDRLFVNEMIYKNGTGKVIGKASKALVATGVLLGIASIVTMLTIKQVETKSNFSQVINPVELQTRIERGESSPEEELLFYANEESLSLVCNNSFHTIKMLETLRNVIRANAIAQEMIREKETKAEVEQIIIDNIPANISDFDVNMA